MSPLSEEVCPNGLLWRRMLMDIVILGSGNVAAVLGRKFKTAGHRILQVISRNASAASKLAYEWDTESSNYPSIAKPNADIYIIAVSDDAIDDVIANIQLPKKVVVHTAASVSKDILKKVTCLLYTSPSPRDRQKSRMP